MATLVLSAAGAAIGASVGGGVLGLSSAVVGRAIGATIGQSIDRRLLGRSSGSGLVETGRVDRLRLNAASEGTPVEEVYGRVRLGGQVIWASRFLETVNVSNVETGGGKGGGGGQSTEVRDYTYSVSVAIALCRGEISRLGRMWADGAELVPEDLNMRVYHGGEDQLPDAKIEAIEGAGNAPAFRGTAYVVIEDLQLAPFGNRVPQFNFEVVRAVSAVNPEEDLAQMISAVALIPGTGEYTLATTPVHFAEAPGVTRSANVHAPSGATDLAASIGMMKAELPSHRATSLVVSWIGDDLRCGSCSLRPKVEQRDLDGVGMPWRVSGLDRSAAEMMPRQADRPIYGGTPADLSVVEAITALREGGREVMFYPFVLMDQLSGNALPDPYGGGAQAALPWRGRITCDRAPGQGGSPDGTAAVDAQVAAFFGQASPGQFVWDSSTVIYSGAPEWSYRRFILHYAHLCAAAGGVDAFCIGSEMRGLTTLRGANGFPAVAALQALAADVRSILGPDAKIGYAADWSEYFGYHPEDGSGDVFFHLDPLWSDPNIDFIGIDNYMPLSDWRDGESHADADARAVYNFDYLQANIEGGEGFAWYYASQDGMEAQERLPIADGAHGEPWIYRYKDLRSWWSNLHYERVGGLRSATPTSWIPESKPFWMTELGCPAVDRGANEPNRFSDPKSSESALPRASVGARDDFMQMQFLRAHFDYWRDPARNPVSSEYGAPMVDAERMFLWAWDARPYPFFPSDVEEWSDGPNYQHGHWLNGRTSSRSLASVVREICWRSGVTNIDVSALYGVVRGYTVPDGGTARAALQPLMLAYHFDAIETAGTLVFRSRYAWADSHVEANDVAVSSDVPGDIERARLPDAETTGRARVISVEADGDYQVRAVEAIAPDEATRSVTTTELPLVLTAAETRGIAERWLADARVARDTIRFALPPSRRDVKAADVIAIAEPAGQARYRVDRVEQGGHRLVEATRVEPAALSVRADGTLNGGSATVYATPMPVFPVFLDLPLLSGIEQPHAPHVAAFAEPWPGSAAVYSASDGGAYRLDALLPRAAVVGETLNTLRAARPGAWDRGAALRVRLYGGALSSAIPDSVLGGANAAAIGIGDDWEVFQFASAELVSPGTYDLSMRLRGQAGTEAVMPPEWPAGARFVLIDGALQQTALLANERGLRRRYRVGPGALPVDDVRYLEEDREFAGIGLRPLAPAHLRADRLEGDIFVRWIRRTRIDGDSWQGYDVPLGEDREAYLVRVSALGVTLREATVTTQWWRYRAEEQLLDGAPSAVAFDVAQISDRFGPGPFRRLEVDG